MLRSDNSALARDCRAETKAINQQLLKLESWKRAERRQLQARARARGPADTATRDPPTSLSRHPSRAPQLLCHAVVVPTRPG